MRGHNNASLGMVPASPVGSHAGQASRRGVTLTPDNHRTGSMPGFVKSIALLLLICAGTAHADSWVPPTPKTYLSADGQARVIINPRPLDGALHWWVN